MSLSWFLFGFVVFLALVGVVFLFFYFRTRAQANVQRSWPTTAGRVLSCKMTSKPGRAIRSAVGSGGYSIKVRYQYEVDGRKMIGDCISSAMEGRTHKTFTAMRLVEEFKAGTNVQVHFNSENPQISFLEPGRGNTSRLIIGIFFLLAGGVLDWLFFFHLDM